LSDQSDSADERPQRARRTSSSERTVVLAIVLATGIIVAFAHAHPTGVSSADFAYLIAAGALVAAAGSRAGRQALIISSVLSLWVAPDNAGRLLAAAAIAVGSWMAITGRHRWAGAVGGGLIAIVLSRLGAGPFQGSTLFFSGVVALPVLVSAFARLGARSRRGVIAAVSTAAALAAAATLVFGLAAVVSLSEIRSAINEARNGYEVAANGNETEAGAHFDLAAATFESTRSRFSRIWMTPARLVPVVGQHLRAVQVLTAQGGNLSSTAAATTKVINPDQIRLKKGRLDLALLDELSPVLDRADQSVGAALDRVGDIRADWLVPQFRSRIDDLMDQLRSAQPAAHTAALAAAQVPTLLGAKSRVDWLILFTTPAEARGLGGLIGNYALVTADAGALTISDSGRNEDLNALLANRGAVLHGSPQYIDRWGAFTPERFFQDVTLSPDLPSVASVASDLYTQATGTEVDGVITLDPFATGALLGLTGPIDVDGRRFTSKTAIEFLLTGQYTEFDGNEAGRVLLLDGLVHEMFSAVTTRELYGPRLVADRLGPLVRQGRIGIWWAAGGGPTDLLDAASLDNRFPNPDDHDLIGVVHQNSGQNKIDVFLDRSVDYRLDIESGRATGTITVTLHNSAPAKGLSAAVIGSNDQGYPFGTNVALVSVHAALPMVAARVDGIDTPAQRAAAFGAEANTLQVEVPPGGTRTIEIDVAGDMSGSNYELTLVSQALVRADSYSVNVKIDGRTVIDMTKMNLTTDTTLSAG